MTVLWENMDESGIDLNFDLTEYFDELLAQDDSLLNSNLQDVGMFYELKSKTVPERYVQQKIYS